MSSTKQRRGETSPVIKEFFSVKNEAYGITKGPDHQSSIDVTENVAYSTLEQQTTLINLPIYETINEIIVKLLVFMMILMIICSMYLEIWTGCINIFNYCTLIIWS